MKNIVYLFILSILFIVNTYGQNVVLSNSIVVGGVTQSSARFWVRTSISASVNIEIASNNEFSNSKIGSEIEVSAATGYSGIVEVVGLEPNSKYYYRAISGDNVIDDKERFFWTFRSDGVSSEFSFAFGSCQQSGKFLPSNDVSVFDEIIKHDLRFFLQLGDWGYPDTTDDFPDDVNFFTTDYTLVQESYWNKFNSEYPMDKLLRKMPVDYVYDDHDYMNNNSSALTSSYYIPYRPNDFGDDFVVMEIANPAGARENSIRGYKENMPGYPLVNESRGIYHKFRFGNIEVFALDLRSQKSSALNAFSKNTTLNKWEFTPPEGHSIIGREDAVGSGESQLDWFLNSLKNSTATWKFIMSSVPFNIGQKAALDAAMFFQNLPVTLEGAPEGTTAIAAGFELADGWSGFPDDSQEILSFIEENDIKNVIVLSGDSHNGAIDDGTNAGLPEIMAGNLDITNSRTVTFFEEFGIRIWNKGGHGISTDEFNDAFGKVTVYGSDSVKLSLIDEFGKLIAEHTVLSSDITAVNNEAVLSRFTMEQNYPNPFNPMTKINYSIPKYSNVNITVVDILGNTVQNLVNENQEGENYSISFDGSKLASGVYFYKIVASAINGSNQSFAQTKKMILLR